MNAPCKDCTERASGCHSHCEKYIEFAQEKEKERENRKTERIIKDYSPNTKARVRKNELNKMKGRAK